jgi:uncharacterized protein (DUF305 family)
MDTRLANLLRNKSNICTKYLSNKEFLIHMIDHHQVAVDMSNKLEEVSNVPFMIDFARNIVYIQTYEIWMMQLMVRGGIPDITCKAGGYLPIASNADIPCGSGEFEKWNPNYIVGCYYPKMSEDINVKCETHFFKVNNKMLKHVNNINFLEHMIPHHQVAVDMSRRLLLHTTIPYMLEFGNNIIKNQQYEIWLMKEALLRLKKGQPLGDLKIPDQFHSQLFTH